jgi:chorismate synthase
MLRLLTAGESHGIGISAILEGLPANLEISAEEINKELFRRQQGYGRGGRQKIETDKVSFLSGVRHGLTLGSPITLFVENKDYQNWQDIMNPAPAKGKIEPVTQLRPGHADFAGINKYDQKDLRNILERASARATVAQVAVGAVCKKFLNYFKINIESKIVSIERIEVNSRELNIEAKKRIDQAKLDGTSLGGVFEVVIKNVPIGLGSHVQADRKLDGRLAGALMALNAVKGVEIGLGFEAARLPGHLVQDELFIKGKSIYRKTNHAGGIEGGISNGEDIIVRVALKPIPTMTKPLKTVDWHRKKEALAHVERADVCAIESAAVIGESIAAFVLADAFLEKFGGDSMTEVSRHFYSL